MAKLFKAPKPPTGEPMPRAKDADLEKLLGMLQDGQVQAVDEDLMAEIVCEVLEHRAAAAAARAKAETDKNERLMDLMSERIEKAQLEMGRRMNEDLRQRFYGGDNKFLEYMQGKSEGQQYRGYDKIEAKGAWRWESDYAHDGEYLVDPDGNRCATISGIAIVQCKNAKQVGAMKQSVQKQAEAAYLDRQRRKGILGKAH